MDDKRIFSLLYISIHASAREATGADCKGRAGHCISIHASAREATIRGDHPQQRYSISIHASAREATGGERMNAYTPYDFNPRLREGGDRFLYEGKGMVDEFQSTPPRGRRLLRMIR